MALKAALPLIRPLWFISPRTVTALAIEWFYPIAATENWLKASGTGASNGNIPRSPTLGLKPDSQTETRRALLVLLRARRGSALAQENKAVTLPIQPNQANKAKKV